MVENNAEARKAYRDAGVEAVYSPDDLPATASVRQMEDTGMGEDVPLTKDELLSKVEELKSSVLELVGELVETVSDLSDLVENVVPEPVVEDVVPQVDLEVDADVVNRMISYFARHEVDKQATGFNAGEDGFPSAGRVAWDAWGGDAGQSWVNGLNNQVASVRAIEGAIGISDFDDTLYVSGGLNQRVYEFIDSQDVDLVVVTGRHEADREATVALLDKLGVVVVVVLAYLVVVVEDNGYVSYSNVSLWYAYCVNVGEVASSAIPGYGAAGVLVEVEC